MSRTSVCVHLERRREVADQLIPRSSGTRDTSRATVSAVRLRASVAALTVEDEPARRLLVHEADRRPLGERLRLAAGQHLEVPQTPDERGEQRQHEQVDDGEPDRARCSGS